MSTEDWTENNDHGIPWSRQIKCIYHLFDHYKSGSHFSVDKENFQEPQIHHQQDRENMRLETVNVSEGWKWRTQRAAVSKEYDNKSTTFQKSYKYLFILR